jgi:predicted transcriptional regulator
MEVQLGQELEFKLTSSAPRSGMKVDDLLREAVAGYLDDQLDLADAVRAAEAELDRGEYLTHAEVGQRLDRLFRR